MEFSTHSTETPVSARTATHMEAYPIRPRIMTNNLMESANTTFCFAMRTVSAAIAKESGDSLHIRGQVLNIHHFNSCVHTTAHRCANVCCCQQWGIVDAVAHEEQLSAFLTYLTQAFHLIQRQQPGVNLVDPYGRSDFLCTTFCISSERCGSPAQVR